MSKGVGGGWGTGGGEASKLGGGGGGGGREGRLSQGCAQRRVGLASEDSAF